MEISEIEKTFSNAYHYPLGMRIAVKFHNEGITQASLQQIHKDNPHLSNVLVNQIENYLRDIEIGSLKINSRLRELSKSNL